MAKRYLSNKQVKQLKNIQARHRQRAQTNDPVGSADQPLGPEQIGLVVTHYGKTLIVETPSGELISCQLRQNLGTLVTGDNVIWQAMDEHTGVVVAGLDRKCVITRSGKHGTKAIAANVDQMLIVLAHSPLPYPTTLDRYLILAYHLGIRPLIGINKIDIALSNNENQRLPDLNFYSQWGEVVFKFSTVTNEGMLPLQQALQDHRTLVVGQSGVGKSSLLKTLLPNQSIRTGSLSLKNNLGQQTTSATRLYHLPQGGDLIDSPGIHQFNLKHFTPQMIFAGFKEFHALKGKCRFRNCEHKVEPGCALLEAVQAKQIPAFRLHNYQTIISDLDEWL